MPEGRYVPGRGPRGAKIAVVGEAPGAVEDQTGLCFSGPSGHLLDDLLEEAGIEPAAVYRTNVIKYKLPENKVKNLNLIGLEWQTCVNELEKELKALQPNVIVPLGDTALRAITGFKGIRKYRGSILETLWGKQKVVPTFHPAHLLHQEGSEIAAFWQKYIILTDLRRIKEQQEFPERRLPRRQLEVARSSLDLYRFLDCYKDRTKYPILSVDIESIHCIPVCIGLAFTRSHAISVPLFDVFGKRNARNQLIEPGISKSELAFLWQDTAKLLADPTIKVIGQNFKYDQDKLYRLGFIIGNFWLDTMLLSHTLEPELPQGLDFQTSVWTEEPYYKSEWQEFNARKDNFSKLLIYNARDAAVTKEIQEVRWEEAREDNLQEYYHREVHPLHFLYWQLETIGVKADLSKQGELRAKYRNLWEVQQKELDEILGWPQRPQGKSKVLQGCNVESKAGKNPQVQLALRELGFPPRKSTDEDTLVALLGNQAKTDRQIRGINLILSIRKVRKTISTYVDARTDYDRRWKTSVRITGTENGRTSTGILEKPIRPENMCHAFQTLTKHGDVGQDVRTMYVPDPGYIFFNLDLSQAEARLVALLSRDIELLALFDTVDIHAFTAAMIFKGDYKNFLKTPAGEPPERFIGKTARHAGNYGMGKHRLMQTVNTDAKKYGIDLQISEYRAGKILNTFHEFTPKIRSVFHKEVERALEEHERLLFNPFGRRRRFYERWGESLFKEAYAFIPQSTVSDHLKRAMLRVKKQMPKLVFQIEAHDACFGEAREKDIDDVVSLIKYELMQPIDFSLCTLSRGSIVIPADIEIGEKSYKDLRKYKKLAA